MATLKQTEIIKKLTSNNLSLFTIADFKKLFLIKKDNTVYKIIERLTKKEIISKLTKNKYLFNFLATDDFQIANFLYYPSYISLETALCFHGILAQFPYQITSITTRRAKEIKALGKEFAYFHTKESLFFGYEKKQDFLIASPEKALTDYLYFCSKGLRNFEPDDFDLKAINKKNFSGLIKQISNKKLNQFAEKLKLC